MKKMVKLVAGAAAFGIIAGTTFQGVNYSTSHLLGVKQEAASTSTSSEAKLTTTSVVNNTSSTSGDVSTVSEQVLPSIVAIDITATTTSMTPFGQQSQESTGSGSGIIIAEKDDKMYIATNNHVVSDAESVTIKFNDGSTASATVKGTDSTHDLAVVEVDMTKLTDDTKNNVKIATIGNSDETKVGEQAIAIGNALGYGTSVTVGYISAKDREIDAEDSGSVKLLQTDAAINPGNSGGALVNSAGEVIGINSSKFASEEIEGMGFAIPMATAEPILTQLMNQETISEDEQAYLGVTGRDITSEYASAYGMPEGIYIVEVSDGSPAAKAGLKQGYIITGINGEKVTSMEALQEKLTHIRSGEKGTLTLKVSSNGEYKEVTKEITFGKKQS
ncbi:MAG: trypsin-like peptidase domain-containing protein [Eubacterium sp.]|nr:trypsin-like peptidase domain-containing protein [Eubacterium sp.]